MASTPYLSVADAAALAQVTPTTIRAWVRAGKLRAYHAGRELRVKRDELDALLATPTERPTPSPEQAAAAYWDRRQRRKRG